MDSDNKTHRQRSCDHDHESHDESHEIKLTRNHRKHATETTYATTNSGNDELVYEKRLTFKAKTCAVCFQGKFF